MKALWLSGAFPESTNCARHLYLWHSLQALQTVGVQPVLLYTPSWKPFACNTINTIQFPFDVVTKYYFSIPRHYFRCISNRFYCKKIVPNIIKLHRSYQFNFIHAHGEISGLAAITAAIQLKIPAVVTIHGIDMCPRMWRGRALRMFKRVFHEADKIIFVGESLQKHFQPMLNKNNSMIVYNGVRLPMKDQEKQNWHSPVRIISVSNLHEGKGVDITLQALANLKSKGFVNWKYIIIGSGDQKKYLLQMIQQYQLNEHVEWMGDLSHDSVYVQLQEADIFCLPSYREAFGIAYLEAMAHGLLTIGVKDQGPQAFIEHDQTGLLVEPRSVDDLTNTLLYALQNKEKMQYIAAVGKKLVLENFTWEKHAEKLMCVYEEVCESSMTGAPL